MTSFITRFQQLFSPKPGSNIYDIDFSIYPYIQKTGNSYHLCYQISTNKSPLVRVLYSKIANNKAYYFFSVPISHKEPGKLVKRDISIDGFIPFAAKNNIYWLNQDLTEILLEIKNSK